MQEAGMRVIGMDVHRSMAVIAVVEGNRLSRGGRIDLTRDAVIKFGRKCRYENFTNLLSRLAWGQERP